ncbi:triphosphoribosyl-dephospho-CoA synthase [Pedobacter rhodius]|uniref:triphosphoribosyl-dephospho-CoA synthase n=1 Tax=Pedobacter rhodius TaxID=3004098 RepID=A0ABT4L1M7_9SPHI|nr:triphosphoribosyl-dephospho-CoA synthase [Pedobacter sp. SJ11]MCZ4225094.1 triphosphoribosyl-dephospho-CoA synthase [Pedobacter sp. SJ11]
MKVAELVSSKILIADTLSQFAVQALLEEAQLTPKPGLVDSVGNGSHNDLNIGLMEKSAVSLKSSFFEMAMAAFGQQPSQQLRERLAAIGRYGEQTMLEATGNVNTHKGAIWAIGLLCGAAASLLSVAAGQVVTAGQIMDTAGKIAAFNDRYMPLQYTKGSKVRNKYSVRSAREEAIEGFPSLRNLALPAWAKYCNEPEHIIRLNVLLTLMASVDDTCILHRSNMDVLRAVKQQAALIIRNGGLGHAENWILYLKLDEYITAKWISPGGSADLLSAGIFLQKITQHFKI